MFESKFETRQIFVMGDSRWVLVKEVLFYSRECDHPQDYATRNVFPNSESSLLGLSNDVSFISKFFCKSGENRAKKKSTIWPNVSTQENCICLLAIFL